MSESASIGVGESAEKTAHEAFEKRLVTAEAVLANAARVDEDAGNLEGLLDLGDMGEADSFEGKARPGVLGTRAEGVRPEELVAGGGGEELAVEEDEWIDELPEGAFLGLSVLRYNFL